VEVEKARDKLLKRLDVLSGRMREQDQEPTRADPPVVEQDSACVDRPRAIRMESIPEDHLRM
jgi:hypothetical protein